MGEVVAEKSYQPSAALKRSGDSSDARAASSIRAGSTGSGALRVGGSGGRETSSRLVGACLGTKSSTPTPGGTSCVVPNAISTPSSPRTKCSALASCRWNRASGVVCGVLTGSTVGVACAVSPVSIHRGCMGTPSANGAAGKDASMVSVCGCSRSEGGSSSPSGVTNSNSVASNGQAVPCSVSLTQRNDCSAVECFNPLTSGSDSVIASYYWQYCGFFRGGGNGVGRHADATNVV